MVYRRLKGSRKNESTGAFTNVDEAVTFASEQARKAQDEHLTGSIIIRGYKAVTGGEASIDIYAVVDKNSGEILHYGNAGKAKSLKAVAADYNRNGCRVYLVAYAPIYGDAVRRRF